MLSIVSSDAAAAVPFLALQPPKPQITYTKSVRYTTHIDEKLSRTVCNVQTWRQLQSSQPSPPPPAPSQPSAAETEHFETLCTPCITTNKTQNITTYLGCMVFTRFYLIFAENTHPLFRRATLFSSHLDSLKHRHNRHKNVTAQN
jgi:hypothetical protein